MKRPHLDYRCIKCLLGRSLNIDTLDIDDDKKTLYIKDLMKIIIEAPIDSSAPEVTESVTMLQNEYGIHPFDFAEIKKYYNNLILNYEESVWNNILNSNDQLFAAVSYAFVGNFIDFGSNYKVTDDEVISLIDDVKNVKFNIEEYKQLKEELKSAKAVTFLLDNCGEIVFDKLLIKYIMMEYPDIKVNVIVRGENILNDVTFHDAKQTGLDKIANVIHNGTGIAGTVLDKINDESKKAIDEADVIISKGMGNFETLIGCNKNIYYIFMSKCEKICKLLNVELHSYMFLNENRIDIQ